MLKKNKDRRTRTESGMHNTQWLRGTDRKEAQPTAKPAGSERGAYVIAGPRGRRCFYRLGLLPVSSPSLSPLPPPPLSRRRRLRRRCRLPFSLLYRANPVTSSSYNDDETTTTTTKEEEDSLSGQSAMNVCRPGPVCVCARWLSGECKTCNRARYRPTGAILRKCTRQPKAEPLPKGFSVALSRLISLSLSFSLFSSLSPLSLFLSSSSSLSSTSWQMQLHRDQSSSSSRHFVSPRVASSRFSGHVQHTRAAARLCWSSGVPLHCGSSLTHCRTRRRARQRRRRRR